MSEVPVPQNGSSSTDSAFACARLTMQRAIFEGIADGWKNGFLRGRRSEKVLLVISVSFKPKMSLSSVIMPMKVLSGFFRLTLVPSVRFRICLPSLPSKLHRVYCLVGIVSYAVYANNKAFAGFEDCFEICFRGCLRNVLVVAFDTKSSNAQNRV